MNIEAGKATPRLADASAMPHKPAPPHGFTAAPKTGAGPPRNVLRKLLVFGFVAAATAGLGYAVVREGPEMLRVWSQPRASWYLAAAVVLCLAGMTLGMEAWRRIVVGLGSPLGVRAGLRIFFLSMLGAYLPGPFWRMAANVHMGRQLDIPAGRMLAAYGLSGVVVLLSALTVGLIVVPSLLGGDGIWLVFPALLMVPVMCWPNLILRAAAFVAKVLSRDPADVGSTSDSELRRSVMVQLLGWLVGGLHLWVLAVFLGASPSASLLTCVGAFALAASAGGLVFVVPDGAGVRELLAMGTLSLVLPTSEAAVAALASRMSTMVAGLLGITGVLVIDRLSPVKPTKSGSPPDPD